MQKVQVGGSFKRKFVKELLIFLSISGPVVPLRVCWVCAFMIALERLCVVLVPLGFGLHIFSFESKNHGVNSGTRTH